MIENIFIVFRVYPEEVLGIRLEKENEISRPHTFFTDFMREISNDIGSVGGQ